MQMPEHLWVAWPPRGCGCHSLRMFPSLDFGMASQHSLLSLKKETNLKNLHTLTPAASSDDSNEHVKIEPPMAYRSSSPSSVVTAAELDTSTSPSPFFPSVLAQKSPSFGMDGSSPLVSPTQEYLDELIHDKNELRMSSVTDRHLTRLLDAEVKRVVNELVQSYSAAEAKEAGSEGQDNENRHRVALQEKIFVPVDKYPKYNFVGRILGPRGMTAKQLEEETGCKIMVRGRGSCRSEPLHVLIHCEDVPERVEAKLKNAVDKINSLLSPPPEGKDELKRKQLIELSIINGTYRPTTATKHALQSPRLSCTHPHLDTSSSLFGMMRRPTPLPMNRRFMPGPGVNECSPSRGGQDASVAAASDLFQFNNLTTAAILASNPLLASEYYKQMLLSLGDSSSLFPGLPNTSIPSSTAAPVDLLSSFNFGTPPSSFASPSSSPYGGFPGTPCTIPSPSHSNHFSLLPPAHAASHHQGVIPPASLQQCLAAAAMLNSLPFSHDGSGDSSKKGKA